MRRIAQFVLVLLAGCSLAWGQTTLYLRSSSSVLGVQATGGTGTGCNVQTANWKWYLASTSNATETSSTWTPSATSPPCYHQTATSGGNFMRFASPPISSGITINGNIDYLVKCNESATSMNAGYDFVVYKWNRLEGGVTSLVQDSANSPECNNTAQAIAAAAVTSTSFAVGDRIVIIPRVQASGGGWGGNNSRTVTLYYEGANTYAHFSQTISFSSDANNSRPVPLTALLPNLLERLWTVVWSAWLGVKDGSDS